MQEKSEKESETLKKQNNQLQRQIAVLADLKNLEEESYFRRSLLTLLERIALAEERQAQVLESSYEEENQETEQEDLEDESESEE